jgi:hypothetical protein
MFYLLVGFVVAVSFHGHVPQAFRSKLPKGEQSGLWTRMATENVSSFAPMKY